MRHCLGNASKRISEIQQPRTKHRCDTPTRVAGAQTAHMSLMYGYCLPRPSDGQIQALEAIAMDMSNTYVKAAKQVIPFAKTSTLLDRFRLMQKAT